MNSSRNRYEIFNLLPVPLAVHDGDGKITFFNRAFEATFGYTIIDIPTLAAWWPAAYPDPAYRQELAALWQQYTEEAKRTGQPFRPVEAEVRCKDGSVRTVLCSAAPIEGQQGQQLAILDDITEQKRVERESRMARASVEAASDAIYWVTPDARIIDANQAACDFLGYAREELLQRYVSDIAPHYDGAIWEQHFQELRGKGALKLESLQRSKDGRLLPVEVSINYVRFGAEELLCAFCRDISERKRAEALLLEAKDAAEAASRAKSQFLANMSHEIRTPITSIIGFAELLEGTDINELQNRYLKAISSSAENLMSIVNDILDLSKIEAGKIRLVHKEFDLPKIVNEVIGSYAAQWQAKKLVVKADIAADVPSMLAGDPVRLKQILLNLVSNAIKFTEQGQIGLSVTVEERQPSAVLLRFDVADTGIGVAGENLAKLFKPFSQVDSSFTRKYGGSGLGLAICKMLSTLMEGDLWVDSAVGSGSTFHLRLPFAVGASTVETEGAQAIHNRPASGEGKPRHILLVEDSETSRTLFVEMLKLHGHRVDVAGNGAEAVEKCRRCRYDMILMDLQMPVMDGIEALERIRAMEREKGEHVPVIALTAHAMENYRIDILKKGFDGYVTKPTTAKTLFNEIRRCLAE